MVEQSSPGGTSLPRKFQYKHRDQENRHGTHNEWLFLPEHDYPMRCPECHRLADPATICIPRQCPTCNANFTKQELRDMSVEAQVVNQNYTGWSNKILDRLKDTHGGVNEPVHIGKNLDPVAGHGQDSKMDVARNMTAWANQVKREAENPARAVARTIEDMKQAKARAENRQMAARVGDHDSILYRNPFASEVCHEH